MPAHTSMVFTTTILVVASIAALTDVRKGVVPNWLTLPVLCGTPLLYGVIDGLYAFGSSLLGLGVCGLTPFILFTRGAIGGGDVKLFAAIGAVGGVQAGMEIQLYSFIAAAIYSIVRLVWEGRITTTLINTAWLVINWVLPRARRREIRSESMSRVRLGGAVLVAALWVVSSNYPYDWGLL